MLENKSKIIAYLYINTKIKIIMQKVMKNVGLALWQCFKLKFIFYIYYSYYFFCFCKDNEVAIGGWKAKHLIFAIKYRDYDLVLELLRLNLIKLSQKYKPNNIFNSIIYLQTKLTTVF